MRWFRGTVRTLVWGVTLVMVLTIGCVFFLTRSGPGIRLAVGQGLERLNGNIRGTVRVSAVESADLLSGALLLGVELHDDEGREVARVDSLGVRYSVLALLAGDVVLHRVDARGLSVAVERLPGREEMNLVRALAPPDGGALADTARAQRRPDGRSRIVLRNVEVSRGSVRLRLPVDDSASLPEGAYTDRGPDGEALLRRYALRDLEAEVPRAVLSSPGQEGERFRIARLSAVAEIQRRPVRVTRLQGELRREPGRLTLEGGRLELSESRALGSVVVDWSRDPVRVNADLRTAPLLLSELHWLVPTLPEARVRGPMGFRMAGDSVQLRADGTDVALGESTVRARGGLRVAPDLGFWDLRLDLSPLRVRHLEPWLDRSVPVEGALRGDLHLDGSPDALAVAGRVTLREGAVGPTTARVSGVLGLGERPGARGFRLDVDPLDFGVFDRILPEGRRVEGSGSLLVEADGWLAEGMELSVDVEHKAGDVGRSRVEADGTVRSGPDEMFLDLDGEVDPLELRGLRDLFPDLELAGRVEGPVRVSGRIGDLRVETELRTREGRLAADARFDARDPAAGYRLDGEIEDFRLSDLFGSLPEGTVVSGAVTASGKGLDRKSLEGSARITLRDSRVARFAVDSATARIGMDGGSLRLDTLEAGTNVARLSATGDLGLAEGAPEGRMQVAFRNDSLQSVRPILLGDTVIAADTLSPLEREVLVLGGIDPDTLPTEAAITLKGRLSGEMTLEGWIDDFSVEGEASLSELIYGTNYLEGADFTFSASRLPDVGRAFGGTVEADSLRWFGRSFSGARLDFSYERPGGRALVEVGRSPTEDYRARATFETDSVGGVVHLDELVLRFGPARWNLGGPATVEWGPEGVGVGDFRLIRPGVEGMRIRADGFLPRRGSADFDLEVRRLSLERLAGLVQSGEEIRGEVDLELHVSGTARSPVASGTVSADSLRFRTMSLSRLEGDLNYENRQVRGTVQVWRGDRRAARVEGTFPADLAFSGPGERIPEEPVDVRAVVDSFPVGTMTTVLEAVEDVTGTVSGEVRFAGTPDDLRPTGSIQLQDGSFRLPGLGIRPTAVRGTVELLSNDSARVDLRSRDRGEIRVQGMMALDPVTNPGFDLTIEARNFQAVDRRDLQGRVGGRVTLTGTYRRPAISGSARVEGGVLQIEEFERSAEVVDLSDPRFFDVVDTSLVAVQPVLEESRNPFLQNLQVDVDLAVQRSWLRSRDMNVEMGGDLIINWNRTTGDLVLTGQLNAIRGTYTQFGRQFQVRDGTVEFVGTPGLNPNLSIQAVTRLRTVEGEPLTITASVGGTLTEPRLSLSSDAQPPIAESDLVSYLLFGRPSFALGSGESAVLQRSAGRLVGEAVGSLMLGAAASQLGSAAVQEVGVDYFAVTRSPGTAAGSGSGFGSTLATTEVEAGWYYRDIFFSLLLRPLAGVGSAATTRDRFAGVRAEWQLGDVWTVEGFYEDRFNREQLAGFGDLAYRLSKVFGFFLYREWGY